jgi:diadenosine tetraphosphate (Ap4A) HIT family hydrolase
MESCPFCTDPRVQKRLIIKNEFAKAFPTNIPIVPGHVLIVPIRHVSTFKEMTSEERNAIFHLRGLLAVVLTKTFNATGFNYAWNEGESAGQAIPHFHLHMIPRKQGDEGITEYEPRKFLYRPGSREKTPEEELAKVTTIIKKNININL